jgi:hypothetical protein
MQQREFSIWHRVLLRTLTDWTAASARSVDRTGSPIGVSQKREYFKHPPETIGSFASELGELGAWRPASYSQKPAIGGHLCDL